MVAIARNHAAKRDPHMSSGIVDRREQMVARDIVEIDVDALGSGFLQLGREVAWRLIVDHRVSPQSTNGVALGGSPRRSDHAHADRLGDLDHRAADGSGR
jgi:hypothetical protein